MIKDQLKPSLKRNTIASFFAQFISYIVPILLMPYLARTLGAENIGIYSFAYSYAYYFLLFATLGFTEYGSRLISKYRDDFEKRNAIFWSIFFLRSLVIVLVLGSYFIFVFTGLLYGISDRNILICLSIVIIGAFFDITYFFRGIEKFDYIFLITAIVNVLYGVSIILFVKNSSDLLIYTLLKSLVNIIIHCTLWIFAISRLGKVSIDKSSFIPTLRGSITYFIPVLAASITFTVNQTLLGILSNNVEVAFYQQTTKIISAICAISFAISPIAFSRISLLKKDQNRQDKDEIQDVIGKTFSMSLFIICPIVIGLYFIGESFVPLYFGDEFSGATIVFFALLPYCLFAALRSLVVNACYFPVARTRIVTLIMSSCILLNIILDLLVLKFTNWGAFGAALSTSFIEFVMLSVLIIFARKDIDWIKLFKKTYKIFISSGVLVAILFVLDFVILRTTGAVISPIIFILLNVSVGGIAYFVTCLMLKENVFVTACKYLVSAFTKRNKNHG